MIETTLLASGLTLLTACGGGSTSKSASVDATVTTTTDSNGSSTTTAEANGTTTTSTEPAPTVIDTKTRALNIITEYAQTNGGSAIPVAQTYAYAGVVGVGTDNISELNVVIAGEAASEVDTTEELQTLVDALGASAEPVVPIAPVELAPGVEIPDSLFPDVPGIPTGPVVPTIPTTPTPGIPIPTIPPIPGI